MFDKITIRAKINTDDIDTIVLKNYLEMCTEGDEVYYKSTSYSNFDGCNIEIRGDTLKCSVSICKLYYRGKSGKLDNSRPITFRIAVRTIDELLLRLCVRAENVTVTYYEIGVTMKLSRPADEYIRIMDRADGKILWNDANYPEYKQKTTEKSKYYRKIMKVYDKTFEAKEKKRPVDGNIIRLETIYKHQSIPLLTLTDSLFMLKTGRMFYKDWSEVKFEREILPAKGVKMSQIERAREIYRLGVTRYKERYKSLYQEGRITKKQWETIRTFAKGWDKEKINYEEIIGELEHEFKEKLLCSYQTAIITP